MTREPKRPDPDALLARIKAAEQPARGRLRIYLGGAPGVGKTFTMLQEAHRRKERGTDVVIGLVETHGRAHTAEQIGDLEIVPPREVPYKGVIVREMDTTLKTHVLPDLSSFGLLHFKLREVVIVRQLQRPKENDIAEQTKQRRVFVGFKNASQSKTAAPRRIG